jgi:type II secretory pathway component PulC
MKRAALVFVLALFACAPQTRASADAGGASGPWIARVDSRRYVVDRARVMAFVGKPLPGIEADPAGGLVVRASDPSSEWVRAGLREGDRIVEINGLPLRSLDDVKAVIGRLDGARAIILGIQRYQRVELYEYRFGDPAREAPFSDPEIRSLADLVRKYWVTRVDDGHYQVDMAVLGLLAGCVAPQLSKPDSFALKSKLPLAADPAACEVMGVKAGDKLVAIDGKSIQSADDLMETLGAGKDRVAVELDRGGTRVRLSYEVRAASRAHPGEPLTSHPEILFSALMQSRPSPSAAGPDVTLLVRGIRRVDENHVEIQRATMDALLTNPSSIVTSVRIVPSIKDGRANGFKLYAIRPTSVPAAIGLQNGDTLQVLNGEPIDTPDRGLAAWNKLPRARRITVEGERRGQPFSITINVADKK